MVSRALLVMSLLLAGVVFADDKPDTGARKFLGEDSRTEAACELLVKSSGSATGKWEDFQAVVNTSYKHGRHGHADVVLFPDAKDAKLLLGGLSDGTVIRVTLDMEKDFDSADAFSLKWKHGSHFHVHACVELALVSP